jgi:hypothetical protein
MSTYYITPLITGTNAMGKTQYSSAMANYNVPYANIIPSNSATGAPLFTWVLVIVATGAVTTAVDADPTIDKLPITSLDQTIGSLTQQQRNTFQSLGTKYGVTAIAGLTNQNTCRDALIAFGKKLDPNFDASVFAAGA